MGKKRKGVDPYSYLTGQLKGEDNVLSDVLPTTTEQGIEEVPFTEELLTEAMNKTGGNLVASSLRKQLAAIDDSEFWDNLRPDRMGVNIALGLVENAGLLAEQASYWANDLQEAVTGEKQPYVKDYSNALTKFAQRSKESIGDFMGYKDSIMESDDPLDISDPAWWATNGAGLIESAGQFILTGYGVGSALSRGASALGKAVAPLTKSAQAINYVNKGLQGAAQLGTAATLAYSEGAMSGAEVFKKSYDYIKKNSNEETATAKGYESLEDYAKASAAMGASTAVKLNTLLNTAINITGIAPVFRKNSSVLKNMIKAEARTMENDLGRSLTQKEMNKLVKDVAFKKLPLPFEKSTLVNRGTLLEAGQESIEELTNVFAEKTGEDIGMKGKDKVDFIDQIAEVKHYLDRTMTREGASAALLGALGGAVQQTGMKAMPTKTDQGYRMNVTAQNMEGEKMLAKELTSLEEEFNAIENYGKQLQEAYKEGSNVEPIYKAMFQDIAVSNAVRTDRADLMINRLEEIASIDNTTSLRQPYIEELEEIQQQVQKSEGEELEQLKTRERELKEVIQNTPDVTMAMSLGFAEKPNSDLNPKGNEYQTTANNLISELRTAAGKYEDLKAAYYDGTLESEQFIEETFKKEMQLDREFNEDAMRPYEQDAKQFMGIYEQRKAEQETKVSEIKTAIDNLTEELKEYETGDKEYQEVSSRISELEKQYEESSKLVKLEETEEAKKPLMDTLDTIDAELNKLKQSAAVEKKSTLEKAIEEQKAQLEAMPAVDMSDIAADLDLKIPSEFTKVEDIVKYNEQYESPIYKKLKGLKDNIADRLSNPQKYIVEAKNKIESTMNRLKKAEQKQEEKQMKQEAVNLPDEELQTPQSPLDEKRQEIYQEEINRREREKNNTNKASFTVEDEDTVEGVIEAKGEPLFTITEDMAISNQDRSEAVEDGYGELAVEVNERYKNTVKNKYEEEAYIRDNFEEVKVNASNTGRLKKGDLISYGNSTGWFLGFTENSIVVSTDINSDSIKTLEIAPSEATAYHILRNKDGIVGNSKSKFDTQDLKNIQEKYEKNLINYTTSKSQKQDKNVGLDISNPSVQSVAEAGDLIIGLNVPKPFIDINASGEVLYGENIAEGNVDLGRVKASKVKLMIKQSDLPRVRRKIHEDFVERHIKESKFDKSGLKTLGLNYWDGSKMARKPAEEVDNILSKLTTGSVVQYDKGTFAPVISTYQGNKGLMVTLATPSGKRLDKPASSILNAYQADYKDYYENKQAVAFWEKNKDNMKYTYHKKRSNNDPYGEYELGENLGDMIPLLKKGDRVTMRKSKKGKMVVHSVRGNEILLIDKEKGTPYERSLYQDGELMLTSVQFSPDNLAENLDQINEVMESVKSYNILFNLTVPKYRLDNKPQDYDKDNDWTLESGDIEQQYLKTKSLADENKMARTTSPFSDSFIERILAKKAKNQELTKSEFRVVEANKYLNSVKKRDVVGQEFEIVNGTDGRIIEDSAYKTESDLFVILPETVMYGEEEMQLYLPIRKPKALGDTPLKVEQRESRFRRSLMEDIAKDGKAYRKAIKMSLGGLYFGKEQKKLSSLGNVLQLQVVTGKADSMQMTQDATDAYSFTPQTSGFTFAEVEGFNTPIRAKKRKIKSAEVSKVLDVLQEMIVKGKGALDLNSVQHSSGITYADLIAGIIPYGAKSYGSIEGAKARRDYSFDVKVDPNTKTAERILYGQQGSLPIDQFMDKEGDEYNDFVQWLGQRWMQVENRFLNREVPFSTVDLNKEGVTLIEYPSYENYLIEEVLYTSFNPEIGHTGRFLIFETIDQVDSSQVLEASSDAIQYSSVVDGETYSVTMEGDKAVEIRGNISDAEASELLYQMNLEETEDLKAKAIKENMKPFEMNDEYKKESEEQNYEEDNQTRLAKKILSEVTTPADLQGAIKKLKSLYGTLTEETMGKVVHNEYQRILESVKAEVMKNVKKTKKTSKREERRNAKQKPRKKDNKKKRKLVFAGSDVAITESEVDRVRKMLGNKANILYVKGLIDGDALGAFDMAGNILLSDLATTGTAYHEAFEFVWHTYLTPKQQRDLIKELRSRQDYGKSAKYKQISEAYTKEEADKEFLAEEFKDYMLSDGTIEIPHPKQKSFFKRLLDLLKRLFVKPEMSIAELYANIEKGAYRDYPLSRRAKAFQGKAYQKISIGGSNFDVADSVAILNGFNAIVMDRIFENGEADKVMNNDFDVARMYDEAIDEMIEILDEQIEDIENKLEKAEEEMNIENILIYQKDIEDLNVLVASLGSSPDARIELAMQHSQMLGRYGIELTIDKVEDEEIQDEESIGTDELDGLTEDEAVDASLEKHTKSAFKFNNKLNAPNAIKMLLASLTKRGDDMKINRFGLYETEDFNTSWNRLAEALSNIPFDYDIMMLEVNKLATKHSEYKDMLEKLNYEGEDAQSIFNHTKLRNQFVQAFGKANNNFYMLNTKGDKWNMVNLNDQTIRDKIVRRIGGYIQRGMRKGEIVPKTLKGKLEYVGLRDMASNVESFNATQTKGLNDALTYILSNKEVMQGKSLTEIKDLGGNINKLVNFVRTLDDVNIEVSFMNTEGERVYAITLNSFLTNAVNRLNYAVKQGKDKGSRVKVLNKIAPHFNNLNTTRSLWLQELLKNGGKLEVGYMDGMVTKDSKFHIKDASEIDKMAFNVHAVLNGYIPFLRAADRGVENMIVPPKLVNKATAVELMKAYIKDELDMAHAFKEGEEHYTNGQDIKYYREAMKGGRLPFTEEILTKELADKLKAGLNKGYSKEQLAKLVDTVLADSSRINTILNAVVSDTRRKMDEIGFLREVEETVWIDKKKVKRKKIIGIDKSLYDSYVNRGIDPIEYYAINHFIGNIEMSKLITGSPLFFKQKGGMVDFTKRVSGANGTKKVSAVGDKVNEDMLNVLGVRPDGKAYDGTENTMTIEDVGITSNIEAFTETFTKKFMSQGMSKKNAQKAAKDYVEAYQNMDEGDAQAIATPWAVREILWRAGDWNWEQEKIYQTEMKVYDILNKLQDDRGNKELIKELIELEGEIKHSNAIDNIPTLKTQYYGSMRNSSSDPLFIPALYKHSISAMMPREMYRIKDGKIEFRNRFFMLQQMKKNQLGFIQFASANKNGIRVNKNGKNQAMYNAEGSIADFDKSLTQVIDYQYLGVQVDISPAKKNKMTDGTQQRALFMNNLYSEGKPIDTSLTLEQWEELSEEDKRDKSAIYDNVVYFNDVLDKLVQDKKWKFLKKLGIELENGEVVVKRNADFIQFLKENVSRRGMMSTIKESIDKLEREGGKLDSLLARNQLENMIFSSANKQFINIKINGSSIPQEASTGWEWESDKREAGKPNPYLKFYDMVDGEVQPMEIAVTLPSELNDYVDSLTEYDEKGNVVQSGLNVLNDMIANGDIDDKLITYFGYRIPTQDKNSIEYMRVKEFLPRESGYKVIVPSELVGKSGGDFDIDKLNIQRPNLIYLKGKPVVDKKSLENDMLEVKLRLISEPSVFAQLISPISDKFFKDLVKEIRGIDASYTDKGDITMSKLFTPAYQLSLFNDFMAGKAGVGQTAVHIKQHALTQQFSSITNRNVEHRPFDMYNTMNKNVSTSGYLISEMLGGIMNPYVDIAKDPYIFYLNLGTVTANTAFYLMRHGADSKLVLKFLSQPLIKEYVRKEQFRQSAIGATLPSYEKVSLNDLKLTSIMGYDQDRTGIINARKDAEKQTMYGAMQIGDPDIRKAVIERLEDKYEGMELTEELLNRGFEQRLSKAEQQYLMDMFFILQDEAKEFQKFIKATQHDTKGLGKNKNSLMIRSEDTSEFINSGTIYNAGKIFKDTMMRAFKTAFDDFQKSMSISKMWLTANNEYIWKTQKLAAKAKRGIKDKQAAMDRVINDYILFIAQNKGDISVNYNKLAEKITDIKVENNLLLDNIDVAYIDSQFRGQPQASIRFFRTKRLEYEKEMIVEAWQELMEIDMEFATELAKAAYSQVGINSTPFTFVEFMPSSLYDQLVQQTIDAQSIYDEYNEEQDGSYNQDSMAFSNQFFLQEANLDLVPEAKVYEKNGNMMQMLDENFSGMPYIKTVEYKEGKKTVSLYIHIGEDTYLDITDRVRGNKDRREYKIGTTNNDNDCGL